VLYVIVKALGLWSKNREFNSPLLEAGLFIVKIKSLTDEKNI